SRGRTIANMVQIPADPADSEAVTTQGGVGDGFEVPETPRTEQLEQQLTQLRPERVVPRWTGWAMLGGGVLMLPWVAGLAVVLPVDRRPGGVPPAGARPHHGRDPAQPAPAPLPRPSGLSRRARGLDQAL